MNHCSSPPFGVPITVLVLEFPGGLWGCTAHTMIHSSAEAMALCCCRHTSRFLVIWLSLMPFTLWKSCHWAIIPVSAIVAFLLLGIEEIGVQIEEPFGILALGQYFWLFGTCIPALQVMYA